jgi:hypothetical protein
MRRYTNWSLLFIGSLCGVISLTSTWWIPEVQPWFVEEVATEEFPCPEYLTARECEALREMYDEEPDRAIAQRDAMNPDNDVEAFDDGGPEAIADRFEETSSDEAVISPVMRGDFVRIDDIHKAQGTATVYAVVSFDESRSAEIIRFEDDLEGPFRVTNSPESPNPDLPNLYIYLSSNPSPMTLEEMLQDGNYVELAPLGGNVGSRDYEIPSDVDITQYESVVIYSRLFNQVYSYAELEDVSG